MKRTILLDSLLLLCFASILIWPLFQLEYSDNWQSIESTFISHARVLSERLPHPGWDPLWYCGTRFDYVYPPALQYGTALLARAGGISTARAYHLYTAILYVFGICAVYWLVRIGSASRAAALLASAATALLSPSFLLLTSLRMDSEFWVPQRLHVLTAYGEGPHIGALSVLPAALAAAFLALRRWRAGALAASAVFCALVVGNNFYGAMALAIFFPIMAWAVWTSERDWRVWLRAGAIVALAFGLSAWWLTPSYIWITLTNLKWVSQPGNAWSVAAAAMVLGVFGAISLRVGRKRPDRAWSIFVAGAAALFSLDVLGFFAFGFRISGEPGRFVPELDLALILGGVELLRAIWRRPGGVRPAILLAVMAFAPALLYLSEAWSPFRKAGPLEKRYEYRIAGWVHSHLPGERVLATGSLRFWFDGWFDNVQLDGGSLQGMLNQNVPAATWDFYTGVQPAPAILWLRAMGTGAIVVGDKTSLDAYHDYQHPERFRGVLPALYDDHHGTVIYQVPRVHPGIGRAVARGAIDSLESLGNYRDYETLSKYVAVVENPEQPPTAVTWRSFDEADVQTRTPADMSVLVQETYDPAWRAYENGRRLAIRPDAVMGFMLIDVPEGEHTIRMRFETPLENRVGQGLTGLSLLIALWLLAGRLSKRVAAVSPILPAGNLV